MHRDNLSGGADECEPQQPTTADDVCPWDVADGGAAAGDKKRSLPTSIAEERERRLSSTSSSRKNSCSGGAAYDSAASADESQSDSVASRLRRSCGLSSGGGGGKRRGSSTTCTPQQTVDRPSVSSAEDFDVGPSPESRSPEKPQPTSPAHEQQQHAQPPSLDAKCNRKKLMKSLSLARKQSVTPVINVSSVDRDNNDGRPADDTSAAVAEGGTTGTEVGTPDIATAGKVEGAAAAIVANNDGNDVCPWEDE